MSDSNNKKPEEPIPCYTTTADSGLAHSAEKLEAGDNARKKEPKSQGRTEGGHYNGKGEEGKKDPEEKDDREEVETEVVDLDSVLSGGCSTCGSEDHDDVDCEVAAEPQYMMSTALPRSSPPLPASPASRSSRTTKAAWDGASRSRPQ